MSIDGVASLQASKLMQTQNWKTQGMIDHKHRQVPNGNTNFMQNMATKANPAAPASVVPAVSAQQGNTVPGVASPASSSSIGSILGSLLDISL